MNVLLTSIGRRSYLVEYFRRALGGSGRVICTNTHLDSPGMEAADEALVVPPAAAGEYLPAILELCRRFHVGLVCSLHDLDVLVLSQAHDAIRQTGAIPVLPSARWGWTALDKLACGDLLQRHGIATPRSTVDLDEALAGIAGGRLRWPLVVKPRMGFGSHGVHPCGSVEELRWHHRATAREIARCHGGSAPELPEAGQVLVQEFIEGPEYCIDVVNDLSGVYACHFMCQVHRMRAGESDAATTVDPDLAGELPLTLSRLTGHLGPWGVDVVERDGRLFVLDVNPRFTGDYPFHHLAGADIPAALVAWASNRKPDPAWLTAAIGIRGFKDLVPTKAHQRFRPT